MGKKGKDKKAEPPIEARTCDWRVVLACLAVAVLPFVIYVSTLNAGFVWDDHNLIEMQPKDPGAKDFIELWASSFWRVEEKKSSQYYRPLTTSTFLVNALIHGRSPRGYHLANIMIYSAVCVLAFLVIRKLTGSVETALLLGLAYAAHPSHVENAAWVSGRTDLVCALFMFASLLFYLKALDENDKRWWAASVGLFILSLFGKEMSITLPAVVAIHHWSKRGEARSTVLAVLPFAVVAGIYWALHSVMAPKPLEENIYLTAGGYVTNIVRNLANGVWLSYVPGGFDLIVTGTREEAARLYPLPSGTRLAPAALLVLAATLGAAYSLYKRLPLCALGLGGGIVTLLPVTGVIPFGVVFSTRFLLIPGFFFLLALAPLIEKAGEKRFSLGGFNLSLAILFSVPVIVVYSVVSMTWAPRWKDDVTLMSHIVAEHEEASLAHFILGNGLAVDGKAKEAIEHYRLAVKYRPDYPEALFNLGLMEQGGGDVRSAEARFRRVLELKPEFMSARIALIRLLESTGRRREALEFYPEKPSGRE